MAGSQAFPGAPRPGRVEFWILAFLLLFWIVLGADTLIRSAFMSRPMTDAQVFFRAGWAIWSDVSLYSIADDNGWPFIYPPTFAVLMLPFAAAPAGMEAPWFALPYPVSVVILYVIELLAFFWAIHLGASALERAIRLPGPAVPPDGRFHFQPWWFLRIAPMVAYLPLVATDIGRGQVTTLMLLSVVGFAVLLVNGRSFLAGLVLSLGVTIKLYPLIALGLPILRRDLSCIAGFVVGLALFAGLVPLLALGWDGLLSEYRAYAAVAFSMSTTSGNAAGEAAGVMTLDAVGFGSVAYKTWAVLTGREIAGVPPRWAFHAHVAILFSFLAAFTLVAWRRSWVILGHQPGDRGAILLSVALLCAIMAPAVPVAQLNYLALGVFLHMALIAFAWERRGMAVAPLWLYALGGFVWVASLLNMAPDLGRAVWLTAGIYPVVVSIAIGFVFLAQRRGETGRA